MDPLGIDSIRKKRSHASCALGLLMVVGLTLALPSTGRADTLITIVPTFAANILADPNSAAIEGTINSAIAYYNSTFLSHAPLTVDITFQEGGGLGGSSQLIYKVGYAAFDTALHAASSGDAT